MSEYLNFAEISQKILFKEVLDWLNVPYLYRERRVKGDWFHRQHGEEPLS